MSDKISLYPDEDASLELICSFRPLLKKYAFMLNYEDAYDDLQLFFIELLSKMRFSDFKNKSDAIIVHYIAISVKNQYIKLSKMRTNNVVAFSELSDGQMYYMEALNSYTMENTVESLFPRNQKLTYWEKEVLTSIYIKGMSVSEIAFDRGKTRQAVNQAKNRGLNKIRLDLQI